MFKNILLVVLAAGWGRAAVDFTITPNTPADMSVTVSGGTATLPDNSTVSFNETVLTIDEPVPVKDNLLSYYVGWSRKDDQLTAPAPDNHASWWDPWQPWPAQGNPVMCKPQAVNAGNPYDGILGGLYRAVIPESLKVMNQAGSVTYTMGTDYVFNYDFGQIGNKNDALGTPNTDIIKADYHYIPQRLDLVQVNASGVITIKKGTPVAVCPALPDPDAGQAALAGVYIARYDKYTIDSDDINIIDPVTVAPVNGGALSAVRAKLAGGGLFRITFFGASVTDGAEAGSWWNLLAPEPYRGRVRTGLGTMYPGASIQEVAPEAHVGGNTVDDGIPLYTQYIKPAAPDVLCIMFGLNDCDGSQGGSPKNPVSSFKEDVRGILQSAKTDGITPLLIAPFNLHPFYDGAARMPSYRQALLDLSAEENVALADVFTAWENMRTRGIVPHTQLHNNKNHPGVYGHQVIADAILDCLGPSQSPVADRSRPAGERIPVTLTTTAGGFVLHCSDQFSGAEGIVYGSDGTALARITARNGLTYRNTGAASGIRIVHFEKAGVTLKYVTVR